HRLSVRPSAGPHGAASTPCEPCRIPLSGNRKAVRRPGNFERERRLGAGRLLRPCAEPLRERIVDQPFGHMRGAKKRNSLYFFAAGGIAGGLPRTRRRDG